MYSKFSFKCSDVNAMEDVRKEILNLNIKRSSASGSVPVTIIKQSLDIYL